MTYNFNRPRLLWVSVGWNLVGLGSVALGAYMLAASEFGMSVEPVRATWFEGGIFVIAVGSLGCFVFLNVLHLWAQWQVILTHESIEARRWLWSLLRMPGIAFGLSEVRSVGFGVAGGGAKLTLSSRSRVLVVSIWFWSESEARRLASEAESMGMSVVWEIP
jgi:hypothetical protein